MNISLATSLIAAGSAMAGILIKILYDGIIEKIKYAKERNAKFLDERKALYDKFLQLHRDVYAYQEKLHDIGLLARAGKIVKPEVIANFPDSPMHDFTSCLQEVRRMAHSIEIIKSAEQMVALRGDAATALKIFLADDSEMYGLPYFLANRLGEDQELEFVAAYRKELGIGPPKGAPKNYPVPSRPWPIDKAQAHFKSFLRHTPKAHIKDSDYKEGVSKKLTKEDVRLLESPRFKELIKNDEPST
ncbi:hypothetical protein [Nonomuraea ceibae]|uniref:hypothetical protein n=1 Tax=Nonomuraea ceibae TaxID=1935170 RepID=UPI001C600D7C|nr:hypothetical protein [Nonomuraea ceibae]